MSHLFSHSSGFLSRFTKRNGTAERDAALVMLEQIPGTKQVTVGGDKAYDTADFVPLDDSFLVTRLWDKLGIERRAQASEPDPTEKLQDTKIIEELNRITEAAKSSDPNARLSIEETQFMQIARSVARKKGKWDRFGPEVK